MVTIKNVSDFEHDLQSITRNLFVSGLKVEPSSKQHTALQAEALGTPADLS